MSEVRVQSLGPAGLLYMRCCAASDATDEEILAVCNKALRRMPSWCRVVREGSNVPTVLWPRPCPDYPDRIHYVVLAE